MVQLLRCNRLCPIEHVVQVVSTSLCFLLRGILRCAYIHTHLTIGLAFPDIQIGWSDNRQEYYVMFVMKCLSHRILSFLRGMSRCVQEEGIHAAMWTRLPGGKKVTWQIFDSRQMMFLCWADKKIRIFYTKSSSLAQIGTDQSFITLFWFVFPAAKPGRYLLPEYVCENYVECSTFIPCSILPDIVQSPLPALPFLF